MDTTSTQSFEGQRRGLLRPIRNVAEILDLWRTNRRVYPNVQLDQVLDAESLPFWIDSARAVLADPSPAIHVQPFL